MHISFSNVNFAGTRGLLLRKYLNMKARESLLPSAEYLESREHAVVDKYCVCSTTPTASVFIFPVCSYRIVLHFTRRPLTALDCTKWLSRKR
jgi:predicted solute-binding protein